MTFKIFIWAFECINTIMQVYKIENMLYAWKLIQDVNDTYQIYLNSDACKKCVILIFDLINLLFKYNNNIYLINLIN